MPNDFESIYQGYKAKGLSPDEAIKRASSDYSASLNVPVSGAQSGEEYANREALVKMYTDLWGFTPGEAKKEADSVVARGPSSDVYKSRVSMAMNHLQRSDPNSKLQETASSPFPESQMANPAAVDPQAAAAQQALNQRRAALAAQPQPVHTPISPGPLNPAQPTPAHLEDANLSSWQSLANLLENPPSHPTFGKKIR